MLDLPQQIGISVYNFAKLVMIQFWRFLDKFLLKSHYELCQMDTDSLYIGISKQSLDDCVKPELWDEWVEAKKKWFPTEDKTEATFKDHKVTKGRLTQRQPGLFKLEFSGDGIVALNSKVYIAFGDENKVSCKGIQQRRNEVAKEQMLNVLRTEKPQHFVNAGFIKTVDELGPGISTYIQSKVGLGYFYAKRKVLEDGISTTHLDI